MKLSLLCPVFNEERYLDEMLRSVQGQTWTDWEVLLVDDGSTDQTTDIMARWSGQDDRIRIVSSGRKVGKVAAFNLAYEASVGDLICHVGGDDVLPTNSLSVRAAALPDATVSGVLFGKLQIIDSESVPAGHPIPRGEHGSRSSPGATYTRELCRSIFPIPAALPSEDIWLGNAAAGAADHVVHEQQPVIHYRMHPGNSNPRAKPFAEMDRSIAVRQEALRLLAEAEHVPLSESFRQSLWDRVALEQLRRDGRVLAILGARRHRAADRLAHASMASPMLWRARQRLGARASGWRGR
jgi:glycosyltransferase involved in cell wall biosynthesis